MSDTLPIAELLAMAAPYNPRKIAPAELERLRSSVRVFGVVRPIVVNRRSGCIVGGHQTVKAAELEGYADLVCGDSSHVETVRAACAGAPIVATVTDPPYGVEYDRKAEKTGYHGPDHYRESNRADALAFMAHAPGDLLVMTYPVDVHFFALADAMRVHGYRFRREGVWCKNRATVSLAGGLCQKHEPILICTRKGAQLRLHHDAGTSTVWHVDVIQKQERHPTEKPLALWQPLVELASARGEHVFEPFSGSGTTIVACEQTGRVAHAVELAPGFCDVAVQRWEEQTGGSAKRA